VFAELPRAQRGAAGVAFFEEIERQLAASPGVKGVAMSQGLPLLAAGAMGAGFVVEDRADAPRILSYWRIVNADYFDALGVRIVSGRSVSDLDRAGSEKVAVVSESFARRAWPDGSAIGRRIGWGTLAEPIAVVGIAADIRQSRTGDPSPHVYMPYRQVDSWMPSQIAVRSGADAAATIALIRRVTHGVDAAQPVANPRTGDQVLWRTMSRRRFQLTLFAILAGLATVLAVVGVYGVLSFMVTEQRRDLGIHAALGATPSQLRRRWLGRGLAIVVAGLVLGAGLSWWAGRFMQGFLFGIDASDPAAHAMAVAVVLATALAAAWIPARRAAASDPIDALRD
jgi:predicted permease